MTSPLPAYAVPGIESADGTGDPRRISYLVGRLAAIVTARREFARRRGIDLPY
jgi:hypothetical protein